MEKRKTFRRKFNLRNIRRGELAIPEAILFIDQQGTRWCPACIELRFKTGEFHESFRLYACLGRQLDNRAFTPRNVAYHTLFTAKGTEARYIPGCLSTSTNASIRNFSSDDLQGEWLMEPVSPLSMYDLKLLGHRTLAWNLMVLREYNHSSVDPCPIVNFLEFEPASQDSRMQIFEIPTDSLNLGTGESMVPLKEWMTMASSDMSTLRIPPVPPPRSQWTKFEVN
ncbi:hypothetical protein TWF679_004200 [Orbilia oligospora]|uniref:Uncharacterized protein n=1 Tax=Orbilia oligospora TaxID=2813651 RepID=A0A8H8VM86_ORBOL|nr:hypothetical protein TWF679_004200 [Orbilia oligospora]